MAKFETNKTKKLSSNLFPLPKNPVQNLNFCSQNKFLLCLKGLEFIKVDSEDIFEFLHFAVQKKVGRWVIQSNCPSALFKV